MKEHPDLLDVKMIDSDDYFTIVSAFLDEGKDVLFTPKGESMLPFIKGGRDSVLLTRLGRSLEVGDIVLVKVGGKYIMHRVFALEGESLTLMGDGNIFGKEKCSLKNVIGLVTEIHKENGKILKPGKARLWRYLRPFRKYILAIYKRVIL